MDVLTLREYETLSPFEIKDFLAKAALKATKSASMAYLNAGRGNPNWIATEPREALLPARPVRDHREQARDGAAGRGRRHAEGGRASPTGSRPGCARTRDMPGAPFLAEDGPVDGQEVRVRAGQVRA